MKDTIHIQIPGAYGACHYYLVLDELWQITRRDFRKLLKLALRPYENEEELDRLGSGLRIRMVEALADWNQKAFALSNGFRAVKATDHSEAAAEIRANNDRLKHAESAARTKHRALVALYKIYEECM